MNQVGVRQHGIFMASVISGKSPWCVILTLQSLSRVSVCQSVCYSTSHFTSHESLHKQYYVFSVGYRSKNMWGFLWNCCVQELWRETWAKNQYAKISGWATLKRLDAGTYVNLETLGLCNALAKLGHTPTYVGPSHPVNNFFCYIRRYSFDMQSKICRVVYTNLDSSTYVCCQKCVFRFTAMPLGIRQIPLHKKLLKGLLGYLVQAEASTLASCSLVPLLVVESFT